MGSLNGKIVMYENYSQFLFILFTGFTCENKMHNQFDWTQAVNRVSWVSCKIAMPISLSTQDEKNYASYSTAVTCVSTVVP
jgi:hypothetical protein